MKKLKRKMHFFFFEIVLKILRSNYNHKIIKYLSCKKNINTQSSSYFKYSDNSIYTKFGETESEISWKVQSLPRPKLIYNEI